MRTLIGLTFLLGLISVIIPLKFIGISTRKRGLLVMLAAFGVSAVYGLILDPSKSTSSSPRTSTVNASASASTTASSSKPAVVPAVEAKWQYTEEEDKMRNQTTKYASLDSENLLSFAFPYNGGSTGELMLRISPKYGKSVILEVSKGQFLCSNFEGCYVHVKFDNQPIMQYGAAEAGDGRSDLIFIQNYAGFVQHLRHAKKVTIEAEFYQAGWQQMEFSATGLNW